MEFHCVEVLFTLLVLNNCCKTESQPRYMSRRVLPFIKHTNLATAQHKTEIDVDSSSPKKRLLKRLIQSIKI
jgi:hypothetical protein